MHSAESFQRRFIGSESRRIGVRSTSEGALFLDGKDVVPQRLRKLASFEALKLEQLAAQATAAKSAAAAAPRSEVR